MMWPWITLFTKNFFLSQVLLYVAPAMKFPTPDIIIALKMKHIPCF